MTFHLADCAQFLRKPASPAFDLVDADTWPGKFSHLDAALGLVRVGGFYVVDDLLPQLNWPDGHALKIPVLINDLESRVEFASVKLAWASGLLVLVRTHTGEARATLIDSIPSNHERRGETQTSKARRQSMNALGQDLVYALRSLSRARWFTAIVVLTLALGIGANSAIFSVVDAVLLRPLPFADPGRVVNVAWDGSGSLQSLSAVKFQVLARPYPRLRCDGDMAVAGGAGRHGAETCRPFGRWA